MIVGEGRQPDQFTNVGDDDLPILARVPQLASRPHHAWRGPRQIPDAVTVEIPIAVRGNVDVGTHVAAVCSQANGRAAFPQAQIEFDVLGGLPVRHHPGLGRQL